MKELQVFQKEELGKIRTLSINNEPWFVLTDVCQILGLSNATEVAKRLDQEERSKSALGRQSKVNIINESGLYKVILRSKKKEANPFIDWITKEVLPTIRPISNIEHKSISKTEETAPNEIQIFKKEQFGQIRTLVVENSPWFVLRDVMIILKLNNISELNKRLNPKGLRKTELLTKGGKQQFWIVNESNFYKCILRSNKKEALEFENWITEEVLPAIRRTGSYGIHRNDNLDTLYPERLISIDDMTLGQIKDYITKLEKQMNKFDELKNVLREINV